MLYQIMTDDELLECNCLGKKSKRFDRGQVKAIPPAILNYVITEAYRWYGVKEKQQEVTFRDIKEASTCIVGDVPLSGEKPQ